VKTLLSPPPFPESDWLRTIALADVVKFKQAADKYIECHDIDLRYTDYVSSSVISGLVFASDHTLTKKSAMILSNEACTYWLCKSLCASSKQDFVG
jgi:hypothetical protein